LRANLDGLSPPEAARYFRGLSRLRRGVLSHVFFPAIVERSIAKRERDAAPAQMRRRVSQSDSMVLGLVQQMKRLVSSIKRPIEHTDWSNYERTHSYEDLEFKEKEAFVRHHAGVRRRTMVWDIGCNTGHFSKICAEFAEHVIAIDGDHDAIEQLYLREKMVENSNILPLNMNLANLSPAQGWAGSERKAFDKRRRPELVLCLALIHHIRLSENIPCALFLDWLRSLESEIIIEFVDRTDDMVIKLLTNKKEQYEDYSLEIFEGQVRERFEVIDTRDLKGGKRRIYMLRPK
jgi:SAM-dependent methyltransferase